MTFYEKMRIVCLAIPAGKVATYGQIAMLCGKPRNSRQVGYVDCGRTWPGRGSLPSGSSTAEES